MSYNNAIFSYIFSQKQNFPKKKELYILLNNADDFTLYCTILIDWTVTGHGDLCFVKKMSCVIGHMAFCHDVIEQGTCGVTW